MMMMASTYWRKVVSMILVAPTSIRMDVMRTTASTMSRACMLRCQSELAKMESHSRSQRANPNTPRKAHTTMIIFTLWATLALSMIHSDFILMRRARMKLVVNTIKRDTTCPHMMMISRVSMTMISTEMRMKNGKMKTLRHQVMLSNVKP